MAKRRRLSKASRAAYLRGIRRGKSLAAERLHRQRVEAARKGAKTRKGKPKKAKPPVEAVEVGTVTIFENENEGWPVLSSIHLGEMPGLQVTPIRWRVQLMDSLGVMVAEDELTLEPVDWDTDPIVRQIRNVTRDWYNRESAEARTAGRIREGDSPRASVSLVRIHGGQV